MKSFLTCSFFGLLICLSPVAHAESDNGYVCVSGYLYTPDNKKEWVGSAECSNAKIDGNTACVAGYFWGPKGDKTWVGSADCKTAKSSGGYSCVSGYLYK